MPDYFAKRNVNFEARAAARTFQLNLTALFMGGNHAKMLPPTVADVKRVVPCRRACTAWAQSKGTSRTSRRAYPAFQEPGWKLQLLGVMCRCNTT